MAAQPNDLMPPVAECRKELRAILSSRVFRHAENLSRLLKYVCDKTLLGEAETVTEFAIGVDVFAKPRAFRENRDSSVRVDVHRLRKRLELYYSGEGAGHALRIVIPLGSYVPSFQVSEGYLAATPSEEPQSGDSVLLSPPVTNGEGAEVPPAEADADAEASLLPWQDPVEKPVWSGFVLAAMAACLVLVAAVVIWMVREHPRAAPQADDSVDNFPPAPAINKEVHILAGYAGKEWRDATGRVWQPDRYFKGGVSRSVPRNLSSASPSRRLVETMREAGPGEPEDGPGFSYDIPLQPGVYELYLYFADPLMNKPPQSEGDDNQNVRRFAVTANGRPLLPQFDAVADAGNSDVDVRAFKDISPASDGRVHLTFLPPQQHPFVNAIELVPARPGHANPVRIAARRISYTDPQGNAWEPDNYFIRGRLTQHAGAAATSDLPELFNSERYGNFSYSIPRPPGSYALTLYFAETFFDPLAASLLCRGPGCRVFDVSCNGTTLLRDFDIYQAGGGAFRPVVQKFKGLRPNGQGKLMISFSPSVNYAEVRALEVVDETP